MKKTTKKSNIFDSFKLQYTMMKLSAAWPDKNSSLLYEIKGALIFTAVTILGILMLMEVMHNMNHIEKLSNSLYVCITIVVQSIKYSNLYINRENFLYIIQLLKNPIFLSYPDDLDHLMVKTIKFLQYLAIGFAFCILVCGASFMILPIFDGAPLPFAIPYDFGKYRYLMYVFQIGSAGICGYNNTYLDTLPTCFISLAITQLEILAHKIRRIREQHDNVTKRGRDFSGAKNTDVIMKLRECVLHHKAIIELVEYIEKTFTFSIFTQFLASVIIICNTLFRFIFVPVGSFQFFILINYLGLMLSELYMLCWFGNDIMWNSVNIVYACYSFDWYYCETEVKRHLYIIMERSKKPLKITAFKFSTLSLTAFTSIMQWSYSYLTLLIRLYKK